MVSTSKGFMDLPNAEHYSIEGDTSGIPREYSHLMDIGTSIHSSRKAGGYLAVGSSGDVLSTGQSLKQKAEQQHCSFTSQDTEVANKKPSPSTANPKSGYAPLSTTNADGNSQFRSITLSCGACEPTAMEGSKTAHSNNRSEPRRAIGPSYLKTSHGRPTQPSRRLLWHSPKSPAEEEASLDLLSCATCQAGGGESTSVRSSSSPSPAPTIALPPLPQGHAGRRSSSRRSLSPSQQTTGVTQIPQRPLVTPPLKCPARHTHIGGSGEDIALEPTATGLMINNKGQELQQSLKGPGRIAVWQDRFEQRKIRAERTQALKKRDLEHTRALQQWKERGDEVVYKITRDFADDTDDTIILPSVVSAKSSPASSVEAIASSSQPAGWGNWTLSTDNDATSSRRTSPVVGSEQEQIPGYPRMRPRYCNHSTQYSPPSIGIPLSPPLSPTIPLFKEPSIQRKGLLCPCCEERRQSKSNSTSAEPSAADAPESFWWYLNDLENRLETRLAMFKRHIILLEAAFLSVTDASSSFGADAIERKGDRPSKMSSRTERSVLLESKLEAMIAGTNGFRR